MAFNPRMEPTGFQQLLKTWRLQLSTFWQDYIAIPFSEWPRKKKTLFLCSLLTTTSVFLFFAFRKHLKNKNKNNRNENSHISLFDENYTICDPKLNPNAINDSHFNVPLPGNIIVKDYRNSNNNNNINNSNNSNDNNPNFSKNNNNNNNNNINSKNTIRVVSWNIERGKKLSSIIKELEAINGDIILLQEVDIGCKRSKYFNVGCEIAKALNMQIIFSSQSWHVNDDPNKYPPKDKSAKLMEWNDLPYNGCEGDAILTKFDIKYAYSVIMPCVRTQYKAYHANMKRHGCPVAILNIPITPNQNIKNDDINATIIHPNNINNGNNGNNNSNRTSDKQHIYYKEFVCYSCHLDAYSGRLARSRVQYRIIYEDIMKYHMPFTSFNVKKDTLSDKPIEFGKYIRNNELNNNCIQYIVGNSHGETIYDGINNKYYIRNESNEKFDFARKKRSVIVAGDFNTHNSGIVRFSKAHTGAENLRFKNWHENEAQWWNQNVFGNEPWFFKSNAMQAPYCQLRDPFDCVGDYTMDYKISNFAVFQHKLDWILYDIDTLHVKNAYVSKGCHASDHQYCVADVAIGNNDARKYYHLKQLKKTPLSWFNQWVLWAIDKLNL